MVAIDAAVKVSAHGGVPGDGVVGIGIWVSGVIRAVLCIASLKSGLHGLAEGAP